MAITVTHYVFLIKRWKKNLKKKYIYFFWKSWNGGEFTKLVPEKSRNSGDLKFWNHKMYVCICLIQKYFLTELSKDSNSNVYKLTYRISANSFRGNYSFLNLAKGHSTKKCGNYWREETIQVQKLFAEIRYRQVTFPKHYFRYTLVAK